MNISSITFKSTISALSTPVIAIGAAAAAITLFAITRIALAYKSSKMHLRSDRIWQALYKGLLGDYGKHKFNLSKINELMNKIGVFKKPSDVKVPEDGISYKDSSGMEHYLNQDEILYGIAQTKQYRCDFPFCYSTGSENHEEIPVTLVNADTLNTARRESRYARVAVLNMAHMSGRGGKLWTGHEPLQEESILRRMLNGIAALDYRRNPHLRAQIEVPEWQKLDPNKPVDVTKYVRPEDYTASDIPIHGCRYSPDLIVVRDEHLNAVAPWKVSMISAAAPCMRKTTSDRLDNWYLFRDISYIADTIYRAAIENGVETLVMGAIGCGGFAPREIDGRKATQEQRDEYVCFVAEQLLTVYNKHYKSSGLKVVFAIKSRNEEKDPIFQIFKNEIERQTYFSISTGAARTY